MTTQKIANGLVALCRAGDYDTAYTTYFAADATSTEPIPNIPVAKGLDALLAKGAGWAAITEVHSAEVSEPLIGGNYFALTFKMDTTNKESGQRTQGEEIALYHVKDGKIVSEQFFYDM